MGRDRDDQPPHPLGVTSDEWCRRRTLRDGTSVLLRQIRPQDRERLTEGLRRLSPASRYLRFHSAKERFSEEELDYLTRIDHVDHEAIVALDLGRPEVPGVGVARYVREAGEPRVAEAAITVADEYHGQGAGTMLLGALAARARDNGIAVFRNYVLEGNHAMLDVFDGLGAERELETDGLWRVDLRLPEREEDLPSSPAGRAFITASREGFRLSSLLPPVWSRLRDRRPGGDEAATIATELASLRDELAPWLADRERRAVDGHDKGR